MTVDLVGGFDESKEQPDDADTFTTTLPTFLPPTHRGKAFRFSYDLVVSICTSAANAPGGQRVQEVMIPIRVWAGVSGSCCGLGSR